ncbi:hypothetical protein [uncultured Ilyobacter sp.]|uniref:HepT-like ribonuclease domain-containing protein n=1 Tax=uncultured Ilyobacter sp. TaxID=544433 RepID=UPI0029C96E67|nr:hypothetical protein [uncultured Ilyobacter sp.]
MQEKTGGDLAPIIDILKSIKKLSALAEGYNNSIEFYNSLDHKPFQNSLELIISMGIASKKISNGMKKKHPEIPWHVMKSFVEVREKECTLLNRSIIFDLIKDKLLCIAGFFEGIILEELENKNFDVEEYNRYANVELDIHMDLENVVKD